jgi:sensor histidine kinase regulating citrate/malate metabolism
MVKNALEASDSGQTVTLSCGVEGNCVWFEVHNPAFMPRNVQLQIFQRSFSTKGDGRGLGTYSIKLLTEQYLGGSVSFASSPEAGTAFRVFYPMT